jgi:cytochrome b561
MVSSLRYPRAAALLHWFLAALVLASLASGWYLNSLPLPGSQRLFFLSMHATSGIFSAAFIGAQVGRRLVEASAFAAFASSSVELRGLLYALSYLLLLLAISSGYLSSSFGVDGVKVFGVNLSAWGGEDSMMRIGFGYMHRLAAGFLGAAVVVHSVEVLRRRRLHRQGLH